MGEVIPHCMSPSPSLDAPFLNSDASETPLHRYVRAFNERNVDAMTSIFATDLLTVHPGEPEVDVNLAQPFLERMQALWPRNIHYKLLRTSVKADPNLNGEVWGELLALDDQDHPLACEIVIYQINDGLVSEICVYKLLRPTHPAYQS